MFCIGALIPSERQRESLPVVIPGLTRNPVSFGCEWPSFPPALGLSGRRRESSLYPSLATCPDAGQEEGLGVIWLSPQPLCGLFLPCSPAGLKGWAGLNV